ncbi:6,7-dimethyl-8-ribityllumazine synthase [Propylenella binzhouense]|uniref:6,7-dimethyl-8-ribityllumazine synthase n=1 Tax=Propylenella binzhouense TaxID=2555902 RepID=A0A964T1T4_9HYPH|nr:6,7-dimethyl-8-ribityllumazine synthase [Propylenella binzhouense]MYZ46705.1 6,7-dimethyl-8-ribityllumazine synthase [Propylenella binzhouense]
MATSPNTPHFLIIDARFYVDLADELVAGATAELEARGATFERISVPGVLEIPSALAMAILSQEDRPRYDGYVLLGCVIRGETSHYDIVANESARAVMMLAIDEAIAVGNGILTCETGEQAWVRARVAGRNKGGTAAAAAFEMALLRRKFGLTDD